MYVCKNEKVKILNELPKSGKQINRKAMVGMNLTIEYYGKIYEGIEIVDYISEKYPNFIVKYNNKETSIQCGHLLEGNFKNIVNHFQDTNNKEIIDGVLHIHIVNKKGEEFTALYSGEHMDEVMNSNWFYSYGYPRTCTYNQSKKRISLHQVDLGVCVSKINNNLMDCRIENLRKDDLLDIKMKKADEKIHKEITYNHEIVDYGEYKKLIKNGKEMLFDCDEEFIRNKYAYENKGYWSCIFVENGIRIENKFHKELFELRSNEYKEHDLHTDHLNNNPSDNRISNLIITTRYSNLCNKKGRGYSQRKIGDYRITYMKKYKFWKLIGGILQPLFKTEQEAINEVNRRREIIDKYRVKLKSKEELEELIEYCLDNNILTTNNQGVEIADLDLGYIMKNFGLKIEDII